MVTCVPSSFLEMWLKTRGCIICIYSGIPYNGHSELCVYIV